MNSVAHAVAMVLLIGGVALEVVAVLGVLAMRDALDRLHYVGVSSFGALLVGVAILVQEGFSLIGDKALLVGVILVALGPVMAHATARSLRVRRLGDWRQSSSSEGDE